MADGYDRFENEGGGGGGSFVIGLLTGTVLGAGLGMLFAPKSGHELRGKISEQAGHLASSASEQYRHAREAAGGWAEKGREMYQKASEKAAEKGRETYDKAREAVSRGAEEAHRYTREATSGPMSDTTPGARRS
jgi:gas vesicle protein